MNLAYFDCFAGAGGDMIVASLLDAGAELAELTERLAGLGLHGYTLRGEMVYRGGMHGLKFDVDVDHAHGHAHRGLNDILSMIESAGFAPRVADRASRIFRRLAEAEAKVHRADVEEIHFHEVGAVDSIVDVVGACLALEQLDVERVICSAIPVGRGQIQCAHGTMPAPAPATAELLRGATVKHCDVEAEMTTPTAAAVLTTLARPGETPGDMVVSAIGYGAGTRDSGPLPNLLRVFLGRSADEGTADTLVELATNIDDCSGEVLGATIEKLLTAGCVDAWAAPAVMKKSRPAWTLSALCAPGDVDAAEAILFAETTTFGIRRHSCRRSKLARSYRTVETPFGPIRIKEGRRGEALVTASPEFADCRAAAETHHVAIREVYAAAQDCYRRETPT